MAQMPSRRWAYNDFRHTLGGDLQRPHGLHGLVHHLASPFSFVVQAGGHHAHLLRRLGVARHGFADVFDVHGSLLQVLALGCGALGQRAGIFHQLATGVTQQHGCGADVGHHAGHVDDHFFKVLAKITQGIDTAADITGHVTL